MPIISQDNYSVQITSQGFNQFTGENVTVDLYCNGFTQPTLKFTVKGLITEARTQKFNQVFAKEHMWWIQPGTLGSSYFTYLASMNVATTIAILKEHFTDEEYKSLVSTLKNIQNYQQAQWELDRIKWKEDKEKESKLQKGKLTESVSQYTGTLFSEISNQSKAEQSGSSSSKGIASVIKSEVSSEEEEEIPKLPFGNKSNGQIYLLLKRQGYFKDTTQQKEYFRKSVLEDREPYQSSASVLMTR